MTITLTINGKKIEAQPGQSVLDAARAAGIEIPTLCHHKDLSPVGSCRLCSVEIAGANGLQMACVTAAAPGMEVTTESPHLERARKSILDLLLHNYVDSGYAAEDRHASEFMHWVERYGAALPAGLTPEPRYKVDGDPNPFVWVDMNKCILCTRCVRACAEVQGRFVWGVGERGGETKIIAGADGTMLDGRCESCGLCAAVCPTGALDDRMSVGQGAPDRIVTTTCTYCGVGCQFDLNIKDERIIRVTSNPQAGVNGIHLCVKGRYGYDFVHHADRLTKPLVREYLLAGDGIRNSSGGRGDWVEVDWDTALDLVADKLVAVRAENGPDAIGVLASAKCTNEENYLMQKFARQVIGTHNIDHCARLCHASTVAGLGTAFGSGAMSNTMKDVAEEAAAYFIIGSNTTEQHPVFGTMLRQAILQRGAKLVVADPRRIDLTEQADLHLQHKPGSDIALINGLMYIILKNGWQDTDFIETRTEDFEACAAVVMNYPPERVAEITGVAVADLHKVAEILALNKPMAVIWSMGITQHTTGVPNVFSLANLQMLLGNMGIPGGGVNPLRGQNNVQGACDMGALVNVFPGYQPVLNEESRAKFNAAWAFAGEDGPIFGDKPGLTVTEQVKAAGNGSLRALYILGENPLMTDPDLNHARAAFERAEFVVLQEIFPTETSHYADVLLPGTSFAEKDGTFTNTERRVQLVRAAVPAPGEARPDWEVTAELARRVLARLGRQPAGPQAGWDYPSPAVILAEAGVLAAAYGGITHARLDAGEQLHWPAPNAEHPGTPILHIGKFTRGLGRFTPCEHLPAEELPDDEYPFYLTTGRVLYHWHGAEMTRRSVGLLEIYPETLVEIHPEDAARLGLNGKDMLRLRSRRGEMVARAVVTERVAPGVVFGNFHFPDEQNVNNLTIGALDPVAKIPEYKVCAVQVELA